jgi:hypothetical protein
MGSRGLLSGERGRQGPGQQAYHSAFNQNNFTFKHFSYRFPVEDVV